ncbi:Dynein regulatory complex protein 10 [Pleodorina starrii]|uniref:Dynein regulatory complex protein 10 n=1 Tax=Pleodorina starrii TaxID=330485 RepID=A0A9W6F820_9CHLO|nr:Dynein regulatory complex protein 10 [Pleodorina starrii]GLC59773.1 Dynein regulatory complex protein 10 [Pleodorina starrii]GLC67345.1 Dynein regulatory complex protein 10 [Pleodorina starrii]
MNSLEAGRVLSVLDETLEGLRLVSYITQDVLDTAEQLRDMLGEDLANTLIKHRQLVQTAKSTLNNEQLQASTLELVRLLKKSPSAQRLQVLPYERTYGILQALQYFDQLRLFTQKRLTTTVEEDSSNREYFEEVRDREERAVAERLQLEQKLRLQRVELQKAAGSIQVSEDRARGEVADVQSSTSQSRSAIEAAAKSQTDADRAAFQADLALATRELATARAELARLRSEHKDNEALLRKARKRAEQDVEVQIGEYDTDVGAKETELAKARSEYEEVLTQLHEYNRGWSEMYQERLEYEERERRLAEQRFQAALLNLRRNHAARVIQAAWRAYKKAKEIARKKAKRAAAKAKAAKKK